MKENDPSIPDSTGRLQEIEKDPEARAAAESEAESISMAQLEEEARRTEHGRKEIAKTFLHRWDLFVICVIYGSAIVATIILVLHLILPVDRLWLSEEQLQILKSLFFSALVTNFAKDFLRKHG